MRGGGKHTGTKREHNILGDPIHVNDNDTEE